MEAKIQYLLNGNPDERPAQVLRIVRVKQNARLTCDNCLTIHQGFVPAEYVLKNGVHLLSVLKSRAIFIEVNKDILNLNKFPLTCLAQEELARKLIILPIGYLNSIVDKIDISGRRVVWMFHTMRCGSTAWAQVFNSIPGWTVISEVICLNSISLHEHQHSSVKSFSKTMEYRHRVRAMIKLYINQIPEGDALFWKTTRFQEFTIEMLSEEFPDHQILMAYRDVKPTIVSLYNTYGSLPGMKERFVQLSQDPFSDDSKMKNARNWASESCDCEVFKRVMSKVTPQSFAQWCTLQWAIKMSILIQYVREGKKIKSLKYDQLTKNRRVTLIGLFRYLGIEEMHVENACKALDLDSQRGTMFSKESRKERNAQEWVMSDDDFTTCNLILQEFDLPDIDSSVNLDFDLL